MNFEFSKITTHRVVQQRFKLGIFISESQYSSPELSWYLYVKGRDNLFNTKSKLNEMGQCWCLAGLLDFQTYMYQLEATNRPKAFANYM